MGTSLAHGAIETMPLGPKSICDGLMARRPGDAPFAAVKAAGVRGITVSDAAVRRAMKIAFERLKLVLEPSGAASLAALLDGGIDVTGKTVRGHRHRRQCLARRFHDARRRMLEADFVIVGSGSAGSALAYRLSEDGKHSVIVIEYGGTDIGPLIQMPSALSIPMNMSRYDWGFSSEPEPHLGGRVLATPRGKVLGGSSSINGMVYVRGHAARLRPLGRAGRDRLGLCRRAALFQADGELRTAARPAGAAPTARCTSSAARARNPLYARLRRGRPPGRFRADRRLQRLEAGRLRRRWSRPSTAAAAGRPPTPICGRR